MNIVSKALAHFGFAPPFHDIDLPDEPSARPELRALHCVDSSHLTPTSAAPGEDRPAAAEQVAAGHPDEWPVDWRAANDDLERIRALPELLNDCALAELAAILAKMSAIVEAATEVVQIVDRIQASSDATVTDLDSRR